MTPDPIDIAELRRLIQEYLQLGGLFNPELMNHKLVRDMIMSVRPLLDEVERLRGIIRECFEDDCWYEQEPDDQTRGWCSDLSMYLRGNAACIVQVTPEMLAEIRKIVG